MVHSVVNLTDQRSKLKLETISNPARKPEYNYLTREIKRRCKERKEEWIKDACKDIDRSYQSKKSREAYSAIKKLTKKSSSRIQSVKSKDGNITGLLPGHLFSSGEMAGGRSKFRVLLIDWHLKFHLTCIVWSLPT